MADFQFYLNRQGAKGEKGDKGDKGDPGNTPIPSTGTNTPTEYTIVWDLGDGNTWETGNLKQPTVDQGGTTLRYDRANDRIVLGEPDLASTANMTPGIVYLADDERIENGDVQDDDAVTYKVFKDKTDDLQEQITEVGDDLNDLAGIVNQNSDDIESLDGRLDDEEANMLIVQSDITTLNDTKASKTELSSGLATKANVVHNHTMSQITDAGSLAKKNNVNYQTEVTNKPTISNNTITIKQGTTIKGTFTLNQTNDGLITLDDPTGVTPGPGLNLDTSTNTLSVKLDNNTLGINSDGEIEVQNAGTTYSEGNAINLTNDTISVKYDNNTLKLNGSGQLYADIPAANDATITITQGGVTKGTFTTNQSVNGTIALDAGPDMSAYYTKTQTDNLLDEKIDNDIVQYPLQYLPDTTGSLTYQNVNTSTMIGSGTGIGYTSQNDSYPDYKAYVDNNTYYDLRSYPEAINLENLCWFETELTNGLNVGFKGGSAAVNSYVYALGHYDNYSIFRLDALIQAGYKGCAITVIDGNNPSQTYLFSGGYGVDTNYVVGGCSLDNFTLKIRTNNYSSNTTISSSAKEILNQVTHIRVFKGSGSSPVTLSLSNIKVINPTLGQNDCGYTINATIFDNYDNIFDAHPESLSLKYDSTTLGVNASNELYAISSTPSNMVTTDTQQIITGRKDMAIINIQPSGSTGYLNYITPISSGSIAISKSTSYDTSGTSTGIILGFNNSAYITTVSYGGNANYINMCTQYSTNTTEIRFCNGYKAGQVGSSHAGIGKYGDYTYIRNNNSNDKKVYKITTGGSSSSSFTNFFLESDMLDGTYLKWDSTTGKITVDIQAIKDAIDALA